MRKCFSAIVFSLFFILFSICFMTSVNASGFSAYLDCPSKANTNETVTCNISVKSDVDTDIEDISFPELTNASIVSKNITDSSVIADDQISIANVKIKIGSLNDDAYVKVKVKRTSSGIQTATASKYINTVSSVNTLKSLKVDNTLVTGFTSGVANYNINTKNSKVSISAIATSSLASVSGVGSKNLSCGSNAFKIKVTAQSGSDKTYTLNIKRDCEVSKVYLSDIVISKGTLSPSFSKTITNYEVKVDKDVDKITITGKKENSNQTISGEVTDKSLVIGSNKISLTVSNSSGEKTVYTINVIRENEKDKDSNTFLSSLTLSSGNITFNKNTFEYETKVLYGVRNIDVLATPESKDSKYKVVGGDGLVVGENILKVTVIAQNGDSRDYIIKVNRLKEGESFGDNANISSLSVKGYNLGFEYNKLTYKLIIKNEKSLDIDVVMDDSNSTYRIIDNNNLKNGSVIKIVTTSTDGTSKSYEINIIKNSTAPYIFISIALVGIAIVGFIFAYLKLVRNKKEVLDVNGFRIDNAPLQSDNKLTKNAIKNNNLNNVAVNDSKKVNVTSLNNVSNVQGPIGNIPIKENPNGNISASNTCPKCGRELLGTPEVCPYCNTRLK